MKGAEERGEGRCRGEVHEWMEGAKKSLTNGSKLCQSGPVKIRHFQYTVEQKETMTARDEQNQFNYPFTKLFVVFIIWGEGVTPCLLSASIIFSRPTALHRY
jgi:hypothetical protein